VKPPENPADYRGSANVQFACRSNRIPAVPFRDEAIEPSESEVHLRAVRVRERERKDTQAGQPPLFSSSQRKGLIEPPKEREREREREREKSRMSN
jgi:hypothetical protein